MTRRMTLGTIRRVIRRMTPKESDAMETMHRRSFLKATAGGLGLIGTAGLLDPLGGWSSAAADPEHATITILQTNDVHSRIDPFPEGSGRNAGRAGAARRATLIDAVRRENPNTLLVDAGDVFQGTPYFNLFKGELDFKVMSALGYDVMTIGNHDFDAGMNGLARAARFADFDMISANYDFSGTVMGDRVKPHVIKQVGPARVGLFGLGVILQGLVPPDLCQGVTYNDPVETARRQARYLRGQERCDLVIALSHLGNTGYAGEVGDQTLAREVPEIDLIVGGHSHTFMDAPTRYRHGERETLVFQVGFAGINLGRVDFHMRAGRIIRTGAHILPVRGPMGVPLGGPMGDQVGAAELARG